MREIIFRGKRVDNGAWETGSFVRIRIWCSDARTYIADKMTGYNTPVIPETVGQYTGLYDKNGVRIWENDIVIIGGNKSFPTMIEFLSGSWQCVRKYTDKGRENEYSYLHRLEYDNPNQYEVIGNRFDNPELLI